MTLPVTVDRANPERLKVEWDEIESSRDRAEAAAEGLAASMRDEPGAPTGSGIAPQVINLSGGDLSQLSEEQRAKLRMLGVDPGALAAQQGEASSPPPPESTGGDVEERIERLERLAKLHEQGVLTDAELAEQKRHVLGD